MTPWQGVAAFAAGFCGGMINSIAGGGTLATFPSLVALGLDMKIANATSSVALWPAALGGAWGYRHHMEDTRAYLVRLGIASLAGGGVGAWLLLLTPARLFDRMVPWLILFATALFMAQEVLTRLLRTSPGDRVPTAIWWMGAIAFQFFVGVYAGYFGAGAGILMLASLGLLGIADIHRANGVKNYLALCTNGVAVLTFVACGLVSWPHITVMAAGGVLGALLSAGVARRLGRRFVRWTVVIVGLSIGLIMLWRMR